MQNIGNSPQHAAPVQHYFSLRKIVWVALIALAWLGCTKSSPFGSEILSDQVADFAFTDTLSVLCSTVKEDSLNTSDPNSTVERFLCGSIKDPVFGSATAETYALLRPITLGQPQRNKNLTAPRLDSIIMYLAIDPKGMYGDTTQAQTFKIYRINENNELGWNKKYYSTSTITSDVEIGSTTALLRPNHRDSLIYKGANRLVTPGKTAYLRIALSQDFGNELLNATGNGFDSLSYLNDSVFWKKFRGIKIKCETPDGRLMTAFNLNDKDFSRIGLFFTKTPDTTSTRYFFEFRGGNKFMHFDHDYAGSVVEQHLNVQDDNELFLQGMTGLKVKIDIPNATKLQNIVVNKAELQITAAELPGDNLAFYPSSSQLVLTDTSKTLISDVLYSVGASLNQGFGRFGGFPVKKTVNGQLVKTYQLTMTQRFQDMVDQRNTRLKGTSMYINSFPQLTSPMRMVFYGHHNASFPARLIVKYTKL